MEIIDIGIVQGKRGNKIGKKQKAEIWKRNQGLPHPYNDSESEGEPHQCMYTCVYVHFHGLFGASHFSTSNSITTTCIVV